MARNALILGVDTATGAYLARLLHARGTTVFGVANTSAPDGVAALGIGDTLNALDFDAALDLVARLPAATLFAVSAADTVDPIRALFAAAAGARLCHIADADALRRSPALRELSHEVAELRRAGGRHALNVVLHAHDSRLGNVDSLPAQVVLAAWRAANGQAGVPLEITETGPRDWGWTAEYVDAVARAAALDRPLDLAIGSGHPIDVAGFVEHAFGFFKVRPEGHVTIVPGAAAGEPAVDTARIKAATGWSASTWGRDLVHALCEGAATRAG